MDNTKDIQNHINAELIIKALNEIRDELRMLRESKELQIGGVNNVGDNIAYYRALHYAYTMPLSSEEEDE